MSDYKVSIVSPEEAQEAISRLQSGPENKNHRRTAVLAGGIELKGSFELVCREADTREIAWTHKDDNLITDAGRRAWMDARFNAFQVGFWASTEAPTSARYSAAGDVNQLFTSGNLTPTNNPVTNTKTVSTTFVTPANNRTLGTIFVGLVNQGVSARGFKAWILAYALLTPPKTQTTTQTLEVVYKLSMSPIY